MPDIMANQNSFRSAADFQGFLSSCDEWDQERRRVESQLILSLQQYEKSFKHMELTYGEQKLDLDAEKRQRRQLQQELNNCREELGRARQALDASAFVYVVTDGDGAVFHERLYALGKKGGEEASRLLYDEIMGYLQKRYPGAPVTSWNVILDIVCNQVGLGQKLYAIGMVPQGPSDVAAFGSAFNVAQPLFNFIDVGPGKERADHKLRELLRAMVRVPQCKHIIVGPSHDSGYIPVLQNYKGDLDVDHKLTLLETLPAHQGFIDLGFQSVSFPSVFRSDNLPVKPIAASGISRAPKEVVVSPTVSPSILRTTSVPIPVDGVNHSTSTPNGISHASTPSALGSVSPTPTITPEFTTVNRLKGLKITPSASNGLTIDIGTTNKKQHARFHVVVNKYDERLDKPLPARDHEADRRLHERIAADGKFCNKYHITGRCDTEDCDYRHGERLPQPELLCLKHKARSIRCNKVGWCRDPSCFIGHHCQFSATHKGCSGKCAFKDTHFNDFIPAKRIYEDGTEQVIERK